MTEPRRTLLVFAREPVAGDVKTRLQPELTPLEAAELYRAFLDDAAVQYAELDCDLRYYVARSNPASAADRDTPGHVPKGADRDTPGHVPKGADRDTPGHVPKGAALDTPGHVPIGAASDTFGHAPAGATIRTQTGVGLGERMLNAFIDAFKAGYERVAIIGTDHPTLPTAYIEKAFVELRDRRAVVVGPTTDGGYYLLGMNELFPSLFSEMTYSHPDVFSQTMERISATHAAVAVLPVWSDVDTPAALISLWQEIRDSESAPPSTRRVASRLARKYGWT